VGPAPTVLPMGAPVPRPRGPPPPPGDENREVRLMLSFFFVVVGMEPGASLMPDKHSTTELHDQAETDDFFLGTGEW
jgi:hypothetical protein